MNIIDRIFLLCTSQVNIFKTIGARVCKQRVSLPVPTQSSDRLVNSPSSRQLFSELFQVEVELSLVGHAGNPLNRRQDSCAQLLSKCVVCGASMTRGR